MTSDIDPDVGALMRREAFDDGYLQGVTVAREVVEKRIVPLVDSLELLVIELRNALGLDGQGRRAGGRH